MTYRIERQLSCRPEEHSAVVAYVKKVLEAAHKDARHTLTLTMSLQDAAASPTTRSALEQGPGTATKPPVDVFVTQWEEEKKKEAAAVAHPTVSEPVIPQVPMQRSASQPLATSHVSPEPPKRPSVQQTQSFGGWDDDEPATQQAPQERYAPHESYGEPPAHQPSYDEPPAPQPSYNEAPAQQPSYGAPAPPQSSYRYQSQERAPQQQQTSSYYKPSQQTPAMPAYGSQSHQQPPYGQQAEQGSWGEQKQQPSYGSHAPPQTSHGWSDPQEQAQVQQPSYGQHAQQRQYGQQTQQSTYGHQTQQPTYGAQAAPQQSQGCSDSPEQAYDQQSHEPQPHDSAYEAPEASIAASHTSAPINITNADLSRMPSVQRIEAALKAAEMEPATPDESSKEQLSYSSLPELAQSDLDDGDIRILITTYHLARRVVAHIAEPEQFLWLLTREPVLKRLSEKGRDTLKQLKEGNWSAAGGY